MVVYHSADRHPTTILRSAEALNFSVFENSTASSINVSRQSSSDTPSPRDIAPVPSPRPCTTGPTHAQPVDAGPLTPAVEPIAESEAEGPPSGYLPLSLSPVVVFQWGPCPSPGAPPVPFWRGWVGGWVGDGGGGAFTTWLAYSLHRASIRIQVPIPLVFFCMDPPTNDGVQGAISSFPRWASLWGPTREDWAVLRPAWVGGTIAISG